MGLYKYKEEKQSQEKELGSEKSEKERGQALKKMKMMATCLLKGK